MAKKENQQTIGKKLTVPEIISYCKDELGISFNLKTEEEAAVFLAKHNFLINPISLNIFPLHLPMVLVILS